MDTSGKRKPIAVVSGGFDPLHSGHINYLKEAATLGEKLVVGLNSDKWLKRKKGNYFLPYSERVTILNELPYINNIYSFDDSDDSARDLLVKVKQHFTNSTIIFCNGGDRTKDNIPENLMTDIVFAYNVGGNKTASSSDYLARWITVNER